MPEWNKIIDENRSRSYLVDQPSYFLSKSFYFFGRWFLLSFLSAFNVPGSVVSFLLVCKCIYTNFIMESWK